MTVMREVQPAKASRPRLVTPSGTTRFGPIRSQSALPTSSPAESRRATSLSWTLRRAPGAAALHAVQLCAKAEKSRAARYLATLSSSTAGSSSSGSRNAARAVAARVLEGIIIL